MLNMSTRHIYGKTRLQERNLYMHLKSSKSASDKSVWNKFIPDKSREEYKKNQKYIS